MVRNLNDRLRIHAQRRARKQRTRRLIEAGGLAEKAGFLTLHSNALYGAFLSLRDGTVSEPAEVSEGVS